MEEEMKEYFRINAEYRLSLLQRVITKNSQFLNSLHVQTYPPRNVKASGAIKTGRTSA